MTHGHDRSMPEVSKRQKTSNHSACSRAEELWVQVAWPFCRLQWLFAQLDFTRVFHTFVMPGNPLRQTRPSKGNCGSPDVPAPCIAAAAVRHHRFMPALRPTARRQHMHPAATDQADTCMENPEQTCANHIRFPTPHWRVDGAWRPKLQAPTTNALATEPASTKICRACYQRLS